MAYAKSMSVMKSCFFEAAMRAHVRACVCVCVQREREGEGERERGSSTNSNYQNFKIEENNSD